MTTAIAGEGVAGRLARHIPILQWARTYERGWLRSDVIAGLTVWVLLVPEGIAYAALAGMPVQAGLYVLLASLPLYAILGTSRHLVVAATSASATMLAVAVAALNPKDASEYTSLAAALVLCVGGIFVVTGLLRLGFVSQFISRPVMEGFVFGLAIFVSVSQLNKLLGVSKGSGNTVEQFVHVLGQVPNLNGPTTVMGVGSLALLFAIHRYMPRVPGGLVVVVLGILVSGVFGLQAHGVHIVGDIPRGLPAPHLPRGVSFDQFRSLVPTAFGIWLVVFSEGLVVAESFADRHGYEVDPNQELVAVGAANLGSGLLGGLVAGGSLSQSSVNEGAGARTSLSIVVAAALALLTVVALTPLFHNLPEAVLAALIIYAVSHLMRFGELRRYRLVQTSEFMLGMVALGGVVFIDVLPGLLLAVVASLLLVTYRSSRPRVALLGRVEGTTDVFRDLRRHARTVALPGVVIARIDAQMYFANAKYIREAIHGLVAEADPPAHAVILDLELTVDLDVTGADTLATLTEELRQQGIAVVAANMHDEAMRVAQRAGLLEVIGEGNCHLTVEEAVRAVGGEQPVRSGA